jgi:signal transduction histidine kinase
VWVEGVPGAFAPLLDKLVENAHDFAPADKPVRISLAAGAERATLAVENDGPALPDAMVAGLFDSMVTLRNAERAAPRREQSHLGLGLYIVRLVAEFHRGSVRALNLANAGGVRFEIDVPLAPRLRESALLP